ncbi:hypothetical protein K0B04_00575 [Patescibacteria group bacterium]|nr:hypothetical protein [Patescibacteria group bacterium]
MDKILSGEVKMKPKWYFVLGSILSYIGLTGSIIGAIFFTNLTLFLIRKRGPGTGRIYMMLQSFPIWIPIVALGLFLVGIWLLKKYDFSYKKNFILIIITLLTAIFLSAQIINVLGLNEIWSRRGPMKNFYNEKHSDRLKPYEKSRDYRGF